jgi:thioredoxin-dependent peroxiredoxin
MPVELRKRKAPEPAPAPAPKKNGAAKSKATKVVEKVKEAVTGKPAAESSSKTEGPPPATSAPLTTAKADAAKNAAAKTGDKPAVGDVVDLNDFGGEVTTHDGTPTTLKKLVEESAAGVVLFTYPKASTPGCTPPFHPPSFPQSPLLPY